MPTHYDYRTLTYQISCSHCGRSRTTGSNHDGAAATDDAGNLVTDFIRWLPNRDRWHSWCRECERAARRASGATNREQRRANGPGAHRKFGVEIEFYLARSTYDIGIALQEAGLTGWRSKGDGSLGQNGREITSPPLRGEEGMEQLQTACQVLRRLGAKVTKKCGLHVHHSARDLDVDAIKRVARNWANHQTLIDGLVAPSRRSDLAPYYCKPLSATELEKIDRATTLAQMKTIAYGHGGSDRYRALNLKAYGKFGTIEIRQHQGTIDFEKIRSWVRFGQAIIDASRQPAPLPVSSRVRDFVARLGTMFDETAATYTLGRAVQFGHATV